MRKLVEVLTSAIVEDKDSVAVDAFDDGAAITLSVSVAPDDMGRLIGKKGRVASALRTVVRAASGDRDVNVDIID